MSDYASSAGGTTSSSGGIEREHVKFKTDFEKTVLISNFEKRTFKRTESEREWNFYWATVGTVRSIFNPDSGNAFRLGDDQILNHFPNHYELTRKDLMVKNLKKYRKELEREGSGLAEKDVSHGGSSYIHFDFFPVTYTMPGDYSVFLDEFKRNPGTVWIFKPNGKSQGKGVFIIHKLTQLKKFASKLSSMTARDSYVCSRYIENPLLIGGKKFDLRLYVLCTSYRPLKCYQYNEGFARFCNVKYSSDQREFDNPYIHLTNVAIQKNGEEYNEKHGNKWSVRNLRLYLEATRGYAATQKMFEGIQFMMIHALKSVQNVIMNDRHCFECYGFDCLIDDNLKPWLLEINASPSLSITTKPDRVLKTKLIHDLLEVVVPPDFPDTTTSRGTTSWNNALVVGNFELLYDESLVAQDTSGDVGNVGGGNTSNSGSNAPGNRRTTSSLNPAANYARGGGFGSANAAAAYASSTGGGGVGGGSSTSNQNAAGSYSNYQSAIGASSYANSGVGGYSASNPTGSSSQSNYAGGGGYNSQFSSSSAAVGIDAPSFTRQTSAGTGKWR